MQRWERRARKWVVRAAERRVRRRARQNKGDCGLTEAEIEEPSIREEANEPVGFSNENDRSEIAA
jgi:hypothetical protein